MTFQQNETVSFNFFNENVFLSIVIIFYMIMWQDVWFDNQSHFAFVCVCGFVGVCVCLIMSLYCERISAL